MKTKSLLTKIFLSVCFSFFAVSFSTAQIRLGVKAGFNSSSISGFDKLNISNECGVLVDMSIRYKPGIHAGIVSQIDLSPSFFLQPELLYSLQGAKLEYDILLGGKNSESSSLHYIQLPVYAGYKINVGSNLGVIVGAGPYLGGIIAGDHSAFKDYFQKFDWGLSVMGGVQHNKFQLTAGYDLGLMDLVNMKVWKTVKKLAGLSSVSNRNIKASVAYFF